MQDNKFDVRYGVTHNRSLVLQLNYPAPMNYIKFLNWDRSMIQDEIEGPWLVAIWRVKATNQPDNN